MVEVETDAMWRSKTSQLSQVYLNVSHVLSDPGSGSLMESMSRHAWAKLIVVKLFVCIRQSPRRERVDESVVFIVHSSPPSPLQ